MAEIRLDEYAALLDGVPWFAAVGQPVGDDRVRHVKDWAEAEKYVCGQLKWLNFKNTVSNRLRHLYAFAPEAETKALVKMVDGTIKRHKLGAIDTHLSRAYSSPSGSFAYHVFWDLNFAGLEFLHHEAVEPVFFLPLLLPQYAAGRYPCGWDGVMIRQDWAGSATADLPRGRVRVL